MINNISLDHFLWGQADSNRVSFRIGEMDRKIHFTFSFHENDTYVNLHITKNISKENRPKVYIIKIDKKVFNDVLPGIMSVVYQTFLEPINLNEFKRKHKKKIRFISLTDILNDAALENEVQQWLENSYKKEGSKKIRVTSEKLERIVESMLQSVTRRKYLLQKRSLRTVMKKSDNIMVWNGEQVFGVVHHEGTWYKMKQHINPLEILYAVIDRRETADKIVAIAQVAIEKLLLATCQADIDEHPLKPMILVEKPYKVN